jgi:hypothetical protein
MTYAEIPPGSLIEVQFGQDAGKAGIVIGAYRSELTDFPLLVVAFGYVLDMNVLPETVEVLFPTELLTNAPVMLNDDELDALRKIARIQEVRAAW